MRKWSENKVICKSLRSKWCWSVFLTDRICSMKNLCLKANSQSYIQLVEGLLKWILRVNQQFQSKAVGFFCTVPPHSSIIVNCFLGNHGIMENRHQFFHLTLYQLTFLSSLNWKLPSEEDFRIMWLIKCLQWWGSGTLRVCGKCVSVNGNDFERK